MRNGNKPATTRSASGARTVGAVAFGAMAVGGLAIGALAIGRLSVRSARIRRLQIDHLVVRNAGACPACGGPPLAASNDATRPDTGRANYAGS
jgi:hypothetical protein